MSILKSIKYVDEVVIFDEENPLKLIKKISPDILIKGADYSEEDIIGAKFVKAPLSMENSPSRLHVETTNNACSGSALKIWKSLGPGMGFFQPRSTHLN